MSELSAVRPSVWCSAGGGDYFHDLWHKRKGSSAMSETGMPTERDKPDVGPVEAGGEVPGPSPESPTGPIPPGASAFASLSVLSELPRWKSHKVVQASKITALKLHDGGTGAIMVEDVSSAPILLHSEYMRRHEPKVGGYFVRYADGYESWSPAEVFEAGYTRVGGVPELEEMSDADRDTLPVPESEESIEEVRRQEGDPPAAS